MKTKLCILMTLFTIAFVFCLWAGAEVIINEVMASNAVVVNGRADDWIELYNTGDKTVSLKGWYLSDKERDPYLWAFPDGTRIEAGGYLLVYCTGGEVADGQKGALYANFKISSAGEELLLTNPDGHSYAVHLKQQYGNISSGYPYGEDEWHCLETATPGARNASKWYDRRAEAPVIETAAGFYSGGVSVTITAGEGLEIRYTTDCSTPDRSSPLYTGPIRLNKTTVIRAAAMADDALISQVVGSTYIIDDPAPEGIAVVSIYSDDKYFFDSKTGFLVKGSGKVANYDRDWEYPAQIEYFNEQGQQQFSQMVTTKISGHSSRGLKQKSLSVYARGAYGSSTFNCRLFDTREYESYSSLLLRMTSSDNHSCRLRDAVLAEISEGMGLYYAAGKPIVLYINGRYYGHYNLREKANKDSLAQWEGITDEAVINGCCILEGGGYDAYYTVHGTNEEWVELLKFCHNNALDTPEKLNYVLDRVDVDSLFSYAIYDMLINNHDAGNVRYYKFPGGKWKFMLHDIEAGGMASDVSETVNQLLKSRTADVGTFPTPVLAALLELPEYRDKFLKMTAQIIESNFLYTRDVEPVYNAWMEKLEKIMPRQVKEFPYNGFTVKEWRTNCRASMNRMKSYPAKVIDALSSKFNLTKAEKQAYFGDTLALLAQYN